MKKKLNYKIKTRRVAPLEERILSMLMQFSERFDIVEQGLKDIKEKQLEHDSRFDKIETKIEHEISEKIRALYDAREVGVSIIL